MHDVAILIDVMLMKSVNTRQPMNQEVFRQFLLPSQIDFVYKA